MKINNLVVFKKKVSYFMDFKNFKIVEGIGFKIE